jgi:pSer/pThr/pTyr-binding forkhead associated (FHA) protein
MENSEPDNNEPERPVDPNAGTFGDSSPFLKIDRSAIRVIYLDPSDTLPLVVGRSEHADIGVMDPLLSRQHFEFFCTNGRWQVRDLNSKNGTHVNGERLTGEPRDVSDEDILTAGTSIFQIEMPG